ncbi:MAG: Hint domain-containing protein [Rhodobacterales bacterium]|nr:Hint domain-containing protein [Rhodobacterales bacterium]
MIVTCFTPGTRIETPQGPVPVQALAVDDLVLTRDHGAQPIRWIGRRDLTADDLRARPQLVPVRISAGALGPGLPERDLVVSPQHRVLMGGWKAELLFGEDEVLAAAQHLLGCPGIGRAAPGPVSYIHLMFDRHELVLSEGAWTESFQPGDHSLRGMDEALRAELAALFPDLDVLGGGRAYPAVRRSLRAAETRVLVSA